MRKIRIRWLSLNNKRKITKFLFFLAILLQILLLLSLQVKKEISIRKGIKIVVKTVPVDPRSLFRGDYINLNYEFSQIDLNKVKRDKTYFYKGQKVFIRLSKVGDNWKVVQVGSKPIEDIGPDEVMISGSVNRWRSEKSINVAYGIESYFVPEGKGKYIEKKIFDKRVKVELSIDKEGYASVRKIFIDEKEVKFR